MRAPISSSKWIISRLQGTGNLITNDFGYVPMINHDSGERGFAVPLDLRNLLIIFPKMEATVAKATPDLKWITTIEYNVCPIGEQQNLNIRLAECSNRYFIGADYESINTFLSKTEIRPMPYFEPFFIGFHNETITWNNQRIWHDLLKTFSKQPEMPENVVKIDLSHYTEPDFVEYDDTDDSIVYIFPSPPWQGSHD